MLPDLLNLKLRPTLDNTLQAPLATREVTDALSDLSPGQRVMAQIQALLPNGAYRAVVAQRELTLALPFAAKAGDSLELEVKENNGKLVLALISDKPTAAASPEEATSASTSLSTAGRLIGSLLSEITRNKEAPTPITLNGNQPLVAGEQVSTQAIAASLKTAISQSGMFYESHQAKWVAGQLPELALRLEPQAKFSPQPFNPSLSSALPDPVSPSANSAPAPVPPSPNSVLDKAVTLPLPASDTIVSGTPQIKSPLSTSPENLPQASTSRPQETSIQEASLRPQPLPSPPAPGELPKELTPIVQHQLDALATQQFAWQGQAWPGQSMHWEITHEQRPNRHATSDEPEHAWRTRLSLTLPHLGGIDATLQLLPGGGIRIAVTADSESSAEQLRTESHLLRDQYEAAGMTLNLLEIEREKPTPSPESP